ncbi:MAG: hypothetical protein K0R51_1409 [Cytophagaceae bacterium]|jgi:hypothetical protein|nr:hypothetical protein [Cytophagaceae bacterium]
MKSILYTLLLLSFFSCSNQIKNNDGANKNDSINSLTAVDYRAHDATNTEPNFELITNISDFHLNGKDWMEIETSGDPDTSLTLFAYRILFTNQRDEMNDCEIRKNLIESSANVKNLMPKIFDGHIDPSKVDSLIDNLNKKALDFAENQVELDIKEYGVSDGPCFELYQLKK